MEKRALIAVVISLIILVVYQEWIARQYGPTQPPAQEKKEEKNGAATAEKPKPAPQPVEPAIAAQPRATKEAREIRVETDRYVALFTNQGGRLKSFTLKQYLTSVDPDSPLFEMIPYVPGAPYPLGIQLDGPKPTDDAAVLYSFNEANLHLTGNAEGKLVFQGQTVDGVKLTKTLTFKGSSYPIGLEISAQGHSGGLGLLLPSHPDQHRAKGEPLFEGFLGLVGKKLLREHESELAKGEKDFTGPVSWVGFGYTYFLFALLPQNDVEQKIAVRQAGPVFLMELALGGQTGAGAKSRYTLFIGPKELELLKSMDSGLEQSIDFGYFSIISIPLLSLLHFSHRVTGSYGIDIILLTVLIKLLTAPLTQKSFTSMKQMQKLQPQMERLKEKFKDDKEKLNKEIMELYRRNKVNPLGGCLPMLLQFPIFIGLYNSLRTPIELRHAPFLWIKDLSRPDWESLPFTAAGWSAGIPILTLLMGASMFLQQWMTPSAGDPNQKRMMYFMPVVFTFMFINFPSGLTIYWLVNNVLSIAQQYLINRRA